MSPGSPRVVIIADDLTGAMDSAVPFARRGLKVLVFSRHDQYDSACHSGDVLSISTNSRHFSPQKAAARMRKVADMFAASDPDLFIKKIDSTLRGNVVSESVALMHIVGKEHAIVCPAVPSQKRVMVDGLLYLDGVVLHDTAIGRDLRSAPPTGPLAEQFRKHAVGWRVVEEKPGCIWPEKNDGEVPLISIGDASSDSDLQALVRSRKDSSGDILFVGASGLTEALAEEHFGPVMQEVELTGCGRGKILFIIGSLAPETEEQYQALLKSRTVERVDLDFSSDKIACGFKGSGNAGQGGGGIVLKSPPVGGSSSHDPERIVEKLGEAAAEIMRDQEIDLLVVTGGDTVQALLKKLGVSCIEVVGEVQPGVVYGRIDYGSGGSCTIVTKAGGFGAPGLFVRILEFHEQASAKNG